jgi:hypothetical protein
MQLLWVDPALLTAEQFDDLCHGCAAGGYEELDVARALLSRRWLAFETDGGILAVERIGRRLYVRALKIDRFGWRMRAFRDIMDRLACDMSCDTVETTCFDERLARAMVRIRARAEAWVMVWEVEGGRQ